MILAGCELQAVDLRYTDLRDAPFTVVKTGGDTGRTNISDALWDGANPGVAAFERAIGDEPSA